MVKYLERERYFSMNGKIQVYWEGAKQQLLILYYIYVPHGQFQVLARCSRVQYLYESCLVQMCKQRFHSLSYRLHHLKLARLLAR